MSDPTGTPYPTYLGYLHAAGLVAADLELTYTVQASDPPRIHGDPDHTGLYAGGEVTAHTGPVAEVLAATAAGTATLCYCASRDAATWNRGLDAALLDHVAWLTTAPPDDTDTTLDRVGALRQWLVAARTMTVPDGLLAYLTEAVHKQVVAELDAVTASEEYLQQVTEELSVGARLWGQCTSTQLRARGRSLLVGRPADATTAARSPREQLADLTLTKVWVVLLPDLPDAESPWPYLDFSEQAVDASLALMPAAALWTTHRHGPVLAVDDGYPLADVKAAYSLLAGPVGFVGDLAEQMTQLLAALRAATRAAT